jgi:hypothetical protein
MPRIRDRLRLTFTRLELILPVLRALRLGVHSLFSLAKSRDDLLFKAVVMPPPAPAPPLRDALKLMDVSSLRADWSSCSS